MGHDPLDPSYHRGDPTAAVAVEHPDIDDVGLGRDADELARGAGAVPGDDPRDVRPVAAGVVHQTLIREVDRGDDAVGGLDEIGIRRHT